MRILKLLSLVVWAAGAAQAAKPPPTSPSVVVNPDWLRKPSSDDLRAAWPVAAFKAGVGGRAVITCQVTTQGLLTNCVVAEETPPGLNFGAAALLLAPAFVMKPKTVDGVPVVSKVTIPINFSAKNGLPKPRQLGSNVPTEIKGVSLARSLPWRKVPTADEIRAAFPDSARQAGATPGQVVLQCRVERDGDLSRCETISEMPAGKGLAAAARRLSKAFEADLSGVDTATMPLLNVNLPVAFPSPDAPVPGRSLAKPIWTRQLDPAQAQALFPQKAADAGLKTGRAVVDCLVGPDGGLTACKASAEEPADMGFGAVAVHIASALAVNLWTDTGEPAEGARTKFAIRFVKAEDVSK